MVFLDHMLSGMALFLCLLYLAAPLKKTKAAQKIKWIRPLLKYHVCYGWLLLAVSLAHGILAGKQLGMISGKLIWMLLLLLILGAYLKRYLKKSVWLAVHRGLSVIFAAGVLFHIIYAVVV